jgi:hypothetical protein
VLEKQREKFKEELRENQLALSKDISNMEKNLYHLKQLNNISSLNEAAALARKLENDFNEAKEKSRLYNMRESHFNIDMTDYGNVSDLYKDFEPFSKIWIAIDNFEYKIKTFLNCDFEIVSHFAGVRPTVKDRKPLIGTHIIFKNIHVLNGLGTRGVMLAPTLAKVLFESIEYGVPISRDINIERYEKKK